MLHSTMRGRSVPDAAAARVLRLPRLPHLLRYLLAVHRAAASAVVRSVGLEPEMI
ncbi:hypothetical protein BURMUCGD2M_4773 [Burkholderia multivorans CGD2M]|uniref:Uncharacterized protein n=1 Tax=Burkholderia multivorans CGD2 TaxID=513052 RepID=B9BI78_9BURK|nr:hypothetical protein BURMUCGD2_4784 [Burkholderia multivorans CGD2]EEE15330.1 hypothetical protein BURMUCGD2M_4773 [Burkholderia multivorans CGD2M]